jgi:hypothetical protein
LFATIVINSSRSSCSTLSWIRVKV